MSTNAGVCVARRQMIDELPVNLGRRHLRHPSVRREIPIVSKARHQSVQHLSRRRNLRGVVGERVAEAESRKGRDDQVERLVLGCIFGLGKQTDKVREGEVREGERGYQEKR